MTRSRSASQAQEASDNSSILLFKAGKHKPTEQCGTCGKATMEGNQEGHRKIKGEIIENHKKLKLRMTTVITD
eukprot:14789548-Ditylum_brightwellii.AAC.1